MVDDHPVPRPLLFDAPPDFLRELRPVVGLRAKLERVLPKNLGPRPAIHGFYRIVRLDDVALDVRHGDGLASGGEHLGEQFGKMVALGAARFGGCGSWHKDIHLVGQVRPRSHGQFGGDPFEDHSGFGPQFLCDLDFAGIALRAFPQIYLGPAEFVQFGVQQVAGFFFGGLAAGGGVMAFGGARVCARQQFLEEGFSAQAPTAADGLEFFLVFLKAAGFEVVRQLFSARRGVLGDAEFAKQAVHAQPERALCPRKPVSWSVCLSSLKNTSMLQRQRYRSAIIVVWSTPPGARATDPSSAE